MQLGGIQKNSFIDFPGMVSCVLFVSGCNFDCPYCHNPELVRGCPKYPGNLDDDGILTFLKQRKGFLDGVVISGGEPTLQNDLVDLCRKVKDLGYPVKLDTNGSRPHVLKQLISNGLVDYLAMDIKTDPLFYDRYIQRSCNPQDIVTSMEVIMTSGLPYEFKTTCIRPLVDAQCIESICHYIEGADRYALQQFHHTEVLHPEFFQESNRKFTDDELKQFQEIAALWVKECIVR